MTPIHGDKSVQQAHVQSIEIPKKNELSIQLRPGQRLIGPSLRRWPLTLGLAEALAASEPLEMLILFSAWHTTSAASTVSLAFTTDLLPHVTAL
jgi:hypothetical protein